MKTKSTRRYEPDDATRRQVHAMAGCGVPQEDIARAIGIHGETLRKYYREELDLGVIRANTAVAQNLFKIATGDGPKATTAAIFWLKTRARWREDDGPAIVIAPTAPVLGKKEAAIEAARHAAEGTEWEDLLPPPPTLGTRH